MFVTQTVLLADAHNGSREEMHQILRASGFMVAGIAKNTDDAFAQFERLQPDAVIIDVGLLGTTDPLLTIKQMRRRAPDCAVFAVGAHSQGPLLMEALTMGAADFFMKPFQRRAVRDSLSQNLG